MSIEEKLKELIRSHSHRFDSSHAKLCLPIIERVHKKMLIGISFPPIKINERLIIDGHHRYVASLLCDYKIESAPYPRSLAKEQFAWESVLFDKEDWEKPQDILRYNKLSAGNLGISLEELLEKLK